MEQLIKPARSQPFRFLLSRCTMCPEGTCSNCRRCRNSRKKSDQHNCSFSFPNNGIMTRPRRCLLVVVRHGLSQGARDYRFNHPRYQTQTI